MYNLNIVYICVQAECFIHTPVYKRNVLFTCTQAEHFAHLCTSGTLYTPVYKRNFVYTCVQAKFCIHLCTSQLLYTPVDQLNLVYTCEYKQNLNQYYVILFIFQNVKLKLIELHNKHYKLLFMIKKSFVNIKQEINILLLQKFF